MAENDRILELRRPEYVTPLPVTNIPTPTPTPPQPTPPAPPTTPTDINQNPTPNDPEEDFDEEEERRPHIWRYVFLAVLFLSLGAAIACIWPQVMQSIRPPKLSYSFDVKVRQANSEDTTWRDSLEVPLGSEFDVLIDYQNLSTDYQRNVVVKVNLGGLTEYVPDSTVLYNSANPDGMRVEQNTIVSEGLNIGAYAGTDVTQQDVGANAHLILRLRVSAGVLPGNAVRPVISIEVDGKTAEITREIKVAELTPAADTENPADSGITDPGAASQSETPT